MASNKRPRWYFSLRSPYSWLAYKDLMERYPDVAEVIDWIPYWEVDDQTQRALDEANVRLPIVAMSRAKNFYILQDTRRLSRARGWRMTWPIDKDPCWEVPHLGYLAAFDAGRGPAYVDAVYQARWQDGRDITDRATIAAIAGELGLDGPRLANACDDPGYRRRGVECLASSYKDGLFGVPFFVHGREKYFGLDRLLPFASDVRGTPLEDVVDSWTDFTAVPEFSGAGADGGPAGGCA